MLNRLEDKLEEVERYQLLMKDEALDMPGLQQTGTWWDLCLHQLRPAYLRSLCMWQILLQRDERMQRPYQVALQQLQGVSIRTA